MSREDRLIEYMLPVAQDTIIWDKYPFLDWMYT
jgi:hypothetical protein